MSGMSDDQLFGGAPIADDASAPTARAPVPNAQTSGGSVSQDQINAAADAAGVDRDLYGRLIHQESGGQIGVKSKKGAIGPAQLMPATAADLGVDPNDPVQNLNGGAKYLKGLLDQFGGDQTKAAAAYNAGPEAVIKYGGVPPFPETQAYVANVVGDAPSTLSPEDQAAWESLHGPQSPGYGGSGYGGAGQPSRAAPAPQGDAFKFMDLHGFRDGSTPLGSSSNPYGLTPQSDATALPDGSWYVGLDGKLQVKGDKQGVGDYLPQLQAAAARQKQVAAEPLLQRGVEDVGQGLLDTGASINKFTMGGMGAGSPVADETGFAPYDDQAMAARESLASTVAQRNKFDLEHATDPLALPGRIVGQAVTAAPLMGVGGRLVGAGADVLGDAAPLVRPALKFMAGEGSGVPGVVARVPANAAQGAGYGALNSSTSDRPLGEQMATGAVANAGVGVGMPVVRGAFDRMTGGIANKTVSAPIAALADQATNKFGIPLRAGQILGVESRPIAITDSNMIASSPKFAANNDTQKSAFTQAVSKTFGADSPTLSPDVMDKAKANIGAVFQRVGAKTNITDTDSLLTDLGSILGEAKQVLPDTEVVPLGRQLENIASTIDNGTLTGKSYLALTRKGSPLDVAQNSSNRSIAHYAGMMRDALDTALESAADPNDLADLHQARLRYKNLMTIAPLVAKGDVNGTISPALLTGAVNNSFKSRAFTGAGDLGNLAMIGRTFLKEPPQSGTAPRLADMLKRNVPAFGLGGSAVGGGLATYMHNPELAVGAAITGAGVLGTKFALDLARERALGAGATQKLLLRSSPAGASIVNHFLPAPLGPIAPLLANQFMNAPTAR